VHSETYILAPNCIIVSGFLRSILIDLQRQTFKILSDEVKHLLNSELSDELLNSLTQNNIDYLQMLIKENVLIKIPYETKKSFNTFPTQFYNSTSINNAIIELTPLTSNSIEGIINSLNNLGCKYVELRVSKEITLDRLKEIVGLFSETTIQSIDIFYPFLSIDDAIVLNQLKNQPNDVRWITIYNCPEDILTKVKSDPIPGMLFIKGQVKPQDCGIISPFYFSINIPTYTESKHYNSCLNCKISINGAGEIKNCPSMRPSFGSIQKAKLEEVIKSESFLSAGQISKDEIKICKDCEFRYICTDCRAYVEVPEDIYSKPLKCGYNPYEGTWDDWSKNPLKKKAIEHYGLDI